MKHLEMRGRIDLGAFGLSLAATLAIILMLGALAGYAVPELPIPVMVVGLGWSAALVLGAIYEWVIASKAGHAEARLRAARSHAARARGRRP